VEGKGPKKAINRPFACRGPSTVDRRYRYRINLPCDWLMAP